MVGLVAWFVASDADKMNRTPNVAQQKSIGTGQQTDVPTIVKMRLSSKHLTMACGYFQGALMNNFAESS
jgi:hypothetical protein